MFSGNYFARLFKAWALKSILLWIWSDSCVDYLSSFYANFYFLNSSALAFASSAADEIFKPYDKGRLLYFPLSSGVVDNLIGLCTEVLRLDIIAGTIFFTTLSTTIGSRKCIPNFKPKISSSNSTAITLDTFMKSLSSKGTAYSTIPRRSFSILRVGGSCYPSYTYIFSRTSKFFLAVVSP
jgi:hypothetical protein